ncbi:MAG: hypothetical protein ACRDGM_17555, partial [bacterium]
EVSGREYCLPQASRHSGRELARVIMTKHYYLSEMAVSDKHGGGLTLQRILQEDLKRFDAFFHLDRFATDQCTIIDELKTKQVNLHDLYQVVQLGPPSVRYYCSRAVAKLRRQSWFEWEWDQRVRQVRQAAAHILDNFDLTQSSWLVLPQNIPSVLVMNRVFRSRPVDYVTWLMDDHVIRWRNGWYYPHGFEAEFAFHLRHARKVVVISSAMARLYRERFGVDAEVVFGPADPVSSPVYQSPNPVGPVRLCYFGAIHRWQCDALERLVTHLAVVDATLDLFGLHDPPAQLRSPRVSVRPPVSASEVISRMRGYDGVVIPASFHEDKRNLTELNIATKMSECFASGTVPVIVAPAYAAMAQFAQEHGGAVIVSDFEDPVQVSALRNLKAGDLRDRILGEARRVVENVCSCTTMRGIWRRAWNGANAEPFSCAGSPSGSTFGPIHGLFR